MQPSAALHCDRLLAKGQADWRFVTLCLIVICHARPADYTCTSSNAGLQQRRGLGRALGSSEPSFWVAGLFKIGNPFSWTEQGHQAPGIPILRMRDVGSLQKGHCETLESAGERPAQGCLETGRGTHASHSGLDFVAGPVSYHWAHAFFTIIGRFSAIQFLLFCSSLVGGCRNNGFAHEYTLCFFSRSSVDHV